MSVVSGLATARPAAAAGDLAPTITPVVSGHLGGGGFYTDSPTLH